MALAASMNREYTSVDELNIPLAASAAVVYKGSLVAVDTTASGYGSVAGDTADQRVVGIALEEKDNSAGAAGGLSVLVRRGKIEKFTAASADQAWVGNLVYVVDDTTVALAATTTNDIVVGMVVKVDSATVVWVDMNVRA